ncbi:Zinc finger SWIM-type [Arabidopsis thaliana x Arabidopsis arenosa]|uniref:Zinc finger SWIM-type n=1 Tax=Arabidopsis thaliana x Arabidopsis arenosa TaxID=1240361 RepID=A0A8T2CET3_9BRAS|nr:Zinc finger SWIM-type [Arabidopsis thaliana x Arabidopsis arenosa]
MAFVVRLVPGEWKKDENGFFEHVSHMDGFALGVRLREQDGFAKVVMAVKEKLALRPEDDIELTYQWPQWMMGPDWKRANPIDILDDEDMTLFMAIRADLDEVHLRVRIIRGGTERNVNSYRSNMDLSGLSSKEISDKYWNNAETRAVWGTALTRMLLRNISGDAERMTTMGKENEVNISKGGEQRNTYEGVTIRDNMEITGGTSGMPQKVTHPGEITSLKGKEKVVEDEERERDRLFEMWRKNQQEEMWREMCATQMTLGATQTNATKVSDKEKTARVLDFGSSDQSKRDPNADLRLTLASSKAPAVGPPVVALSSSDSTFGTPTSLSRSISFSTEDLMEDSESSNDNSLSLLGDETLAHFYSDPDGPLIMDPQPITMIDKGKSIMIEDGLSTKEIGMPSTNTRVSDVQRNEMIVKDTPVPTVFYDSDAPPYFDDPGEEAASFLSFSDALQRALKDADYEGDDIYIGRIFKTKEDCATKLAIHAIRRKFHFIYAKSGPNVVAAVCVSHTCPWRVYATKLADSDRFEVRSTTPNHTCSVDARGDFHKQASTAVIGKLMRTKYIGVGRGPRANELRRMLRQEFSLNVSYWKAWRAREIAMDNAMGSAMGSYALIQPYFKLLLETNPNSLVAMETEKDNSGIERFKYLFFALHACVQGYAYMRKAIVIDGTHLRGRYGGCLIAASAQDANFQVFPIAFGIVNSENDEAWTWFMTKLTEAIPDDPELVFVSDRHSSIYASIRKLSALVSCAARAYRLSDFNRLFAEIRAKDGACADYLAGIGFEHWTRSHFVGNRYNFMTSNIAESLNNVLTMARDYPVISILESIRTTLVTWFALRRQAAQLEDNILPPKVNDMVIENYEKGAGCAVIKIGEGLYEVREKGGAAFAVNLWERTCTCREFQLLTIPCSHAIAAAIQEGIRVDTLVGVHHTNPQLRLSYQALIMPVPDTETLTPSPNDVGGGKLAPPYVRRPPGRPRKRRLFSRGEFKRTSRKRCSRCKSLGEIENGRKDVFWRLKRWMDVVRINKEIGLAM